MRWTGYRRDVPNTVEHGGGTGSESPFSSDRSRANIETSSRRSICGACKHYLTGVLLPSRARLHLVLMTRNRFADQ